MNRGLLRLAVKAGLRIFEVVTRQHHLAQNDYRAAIALQVTLRPKGDITLSTFRSTTFSTLVDQSNL